MSRKINFILLTFFLIGLCTSSCTKDKVPSPQPCESVKTYEEAVREIIQTTCNSSGCHDGSSGVGNYNSYEGMLSALKNDLFRQEVVIKRTMPKDDFLTEEEFEILKCWAENDYPKE